MISWKWQGWRAFLANINVILVKSHGVTYRVKILSYRIWIESWGWKRNLQRILPFVRLKRETRLITRTFFDVWFRCIHETEIRTYSLSSFPHFYHIFITSNLIWIFENRHMSRIYNFSNSSFAKLTFQYIR